MIMEQSRPVALAVASLPIEGFILLVELLNTTSGSPDKIPIEDLIFTIERLTIFVLAWSMKTSSNIQSARPIATPLLELAMTNEVAITT